MLGETYHANPRDLIEPWAVAVVQLWALCRGEMGGFAQLPDSGGINDQSAWLMDAFGACGAADAELREEERQRADQR